MPTNDSTLVLQRQLKAPRERVFKAFTQPDAMVKWSPPHGFTARMHSHELAVGKGYRMSFTNLGAGEEHKFGGTFLEITPPERLRYNDQFEDPNLPGTMEVTIELRESLIGTEVTITQTNLPKEIPMEFAVAGWQESLDLLKLLVEPEIPASAAAE